MTTSSVLGFRSLLQRTITFFFLIYLMFHEIERVIIRPRDLSQGSPLTVLVPLWHWSQFVLTLVLVSKSHLPTKPPLSCLRGNSLLIWYVKKTAPDIIYSWKIKMRNIIVYECHKIDLYCRVIHQLGTIYSCERTERENFFGKVTLQKLSICSELCSEER